MAKGPSAPGIHGIPPLDHSEVQNTIILHDQVRTCGGISEVKVACIADWWRLKRREKNARRSRARAGRRSIPQIVVHCTGRRRVRRAVTARHASGPRTCRKWRDDHIAAAELASLGSSCCFPSARVALIQWLGDRVACLPSSCYEGGRRTAKNAWAFLSQWCVLWGQANGAIWA